MARTRLIEMLAYLSSEVHVAFKPLWHHASEAEKAKAREAIAERLEFLADEMPGPFLFGPHFTVADAYLFVMLRWARAFGHPLSPKLTGYFARILERSAVRRALAEEALVEEAPIIEVLTAETPA